MALLDHEGDHPLMNAAPSRECVAVRRVGPIACVCVSLLPRESRYSSRERDPSICNMWEREGSIESCTAIVSTAMVPQGPGIGPIPNTSAEVVS